MTKPVTKIKADEMACCHECGVENTSDDALKWARKHANKTGHSPTVTITYDIYPSNRKWTQDE